MSRTTTSVLSASSLDASLAEADLGRRGKDETLAEPRSSAPPPDAGERCRPPALNMDPEGARGLEATRACPTRDTAGPASHGAECPLKRRNCDEALREACH